MEPTPPVSAFAAVDLVSGGSRTLQPAAPACGAGESCWATYPLRPHYHVGSSTITYPDRGEPAPTSVRKSDVVEMQQHLERLEAKLDALTKALKAGAIGRWQ